MIKVCVSVMFLYAGWQKNANHNRKKIMNKQYFCKCVHAVFKGKMVDIWYKLINTKIL